MSLLTAVFLDGKRIGRTLPQFEFPEKEKISKKEKTKVQIDAPFHNLPSFVVMRVPRSCFKLLHLFEYLKIISFLAPSNVVLLGNTNKACFNMSRDEKRWEELCRSINKKKIDDFSWMQVFRVCVCMCIFVMCVGWLY